jgi:hypothetical protein
MTLAQGISSGDHAVSATFKKCSIQTSSGQATAFCQAVHGIVGGWAGDVSSANSQGPNGFVASRRTS